MTPPTYDLDEVEWLAREAQALIEGYHPVLFPGAGAAFHNAASPTVVLDLIRRVREAEAKPDPDDETPRALTAAEREELLRRCRPSRGLTRERLSDVVAEIRGRK